MSRKLSIRAEVSNAVENTMGYGRASEAEIVEPAPSWLLELVKSRRSFLVIGGSGREKQRSIYQLEPELRAYAITKKQSLEAIEATTDTLEQFVESCSLFRSQTTLELLEFESELVVIDGELLVNAKSYDSIYNRHGAASLYNRLASIVKKMIKLSRVLTSGNGNELKVIYTAQTSPHSFANDSSVSIFIGDAILSALQLQIEVMALVERA